MLIFRIRSGNLCKHAKRFTSKLYLVISKINWNNTNKEVSTGYEVMFFNDMHTFLVKKTPFVWDIVSQIGDVPSSRDSHKMCVVNKKVYLCGGKNNIVSKECLAGMHEFDTETCKWIAVDTTGYCPRDVGFSASVVDKSIYTFGGMLGGITTNSMRCFNTEQKCWSIIETKGCRPHPRCDHTSEAIRDVIYIFGGVGNVNEWLNDLHCFNTTTQTWSHPTIRGVPPSPRCSHTFVAHRDKDIYVLGGWRKENKEDKIVRNLRKLSIGNQKWKTLLCAGERPPPPIYGHCSFICHSSMYILGGMGSSGESSMNVVYILRLVNPSERSLVLAQALKDLSED
ncbi:rab9 effector protein with kelch motifs-like isoform X2 [Styela clava]